MGRPKGSKNSKKRKAPRTPYQTYSDWYDQYTKEYAGADKSKWFRPKLHEKALYDKDEDSFEYQYKIARAKGVPNPARYVAMSQEYVERSFERGYKRLYGKNLPDITDKKVRKQIAQDYVNDLISQGLTESDAWEEFREYFY